MGIDGMYSPGAVPRRPSGEPRGLSRPAENKASGNIEPGNATPREDKLVKSSDAGDMKAYGFKDMLSSEQKDAINNQRIGSFKTLLERMIGEQCEEAGGNRTDGGDCSVQRVSGKIIDLARSLAGGDKSKIELLRKAAEEGFESVKQTYGDKLADVSRATYGDIMESFRRWEKAE